MRSLLVLTALLLALQASVQAKTVKKQLMDTVLERPPLLEQETNEIETPSKAVDVAKPLVEEGKAEGTAKEGEPIKQQTNDKRKPPVGAGAAPKEGATQKRPNDKRKPQVGAGAAAKEGATQKKPNDKRKPQEGANAAAKEGATQKKPNDKRKPQVGAGAAAKEGATQKKPNDKRKPQAGAGAAAKEGATQKKPKESKQKQEVTESPDNVDEEDTEDTATENEGETLEAGDCHPRICSRMYIPVCGEINGRPVTAPSLCEFTNHVLCARMRTRTGRRAPVVRFLHNGRCR